MGWWCNIFISKNQKVLVCCKTCIMVIDLDQRSQTTEIQRRFQTLYTTQSSAKGLKLGIFGFCPSHMQKQMQNKCVTIFPYLVAFYVYLSSRWDCSRCWWHEPLLFWLRGKHRDLHFWAPCRDKNTACLGISLVYLCPTP